MIDQTLDVGIVLAFYIPSVALIVWAVDEVIETLARRTGSRRQRSTRAARVIRGSAANGPQVAEEHHLHLLLIAGDITPADLITGAPREAGHPTWSAAA